MAQRKITHHLKEYAQRHGWDAVSMIPDGTQGHSDSPEGTLAFMQLDPAPDGRYCVDLQGMRAAVAIASLCNAAS